MSDQKSFNSSALKFNPYNKMRFPQTIGSPANVGVRSVVDSVVDNVSNYAVFYPFSGNNPYYTKGSVESNGYYSGPDFTMGSNYYIPLGFCDKTSDTNCVGQQRWVYVRNIPTGTIPLLGNVSFRGLTGCNMPGLTENRGIVGGFMEDLSDIEPIAIFDALAGNGNFGSFKCKKMSFPVGTNIYDEKMEGKTWNNETKCTSSFRNLKQSTTGHAQLFPGGYVPFQSEAFLNYEEKKEKWLILLPIVAIVLFFLLKKK